MAGVSISGDNSSYTVGLTMADSTFRYHVFIADLSSTGSITGYYCRRSSLGVAGSTWTYHGTSSSPYSNYKRRVIVRTSTSATSHTVGGFYSYSEVTSGTNSYYDGYIPAATSSTYTYYLYYNANGGSGAPATQSSGSTTNTGWTFTISSTEPTRSGYTFLGWSTSSTATSASYQPGDTIHRSSSSPTVTLYAVWEETSYTYYFRTLGGVTFWVYKNGTATLLLSKDSGILSMSVTASDTVTVCSPTTTGTPGYTLWTGYTKPVYIYFDGSDSLFQNTSPTNIEDDHVVSWKGRNRRIQLQATGQSLNYYFRCMTGVAYYYVYKNGSVALQVSGTDDTVLSGVTVDDTITVGTSTTSGTPGVIHESGYVSPDYIYFDSGSGYYQSTDPTDLQDDHVVSWKGYSRYIQIRATMGATKYRIHAFGNGGTIAGADDVYRPSSSTWYETSGVTVELNVSNGIVKNENGDTVLPIPVRSGYTFNGWAQWSSSDSGVITGTVMVNASVDGTTNNLYATWKKNQISLFYWDGASSEANSNDKLLIATGQPVGNITGGQNGNWNRLKAKIAELRTAQGGSWSYSTVSSGAAMTAAEFNDVRSGIDACDGHGTLPSAVSQNGIIYAHYFQSTTSNPNSLKSALNTAITTYNTT